MVQQRVILAAMIFLSTGLFFSFRLNFPLLLTQMVYPPNSGANNDTSTSEGELICPIKVHGSKNTPNLIEEDNPNRFHWSQTTQGSIVSLLLWGSVAFQIPSGILVQWYGGKSILLASFILGAISFALSPTAVFYGDSIGLIVAQFANGVAQALFFASLPTFTVTWFPIEKRGRITSVIAVGMNSFAFISSYLMGLTIEHTGRWDFVYYGFALTTVVTGILVAVLVYDNPQKHPWIGAKEQKYLKSKTENYLQTEKEDLPPTPWRAMLTNTPVLVLILSLILFRLGSGALQIGISKYLNDVLHVQILDNSIYNSISRILNLIISLSVGILSDYLYSKRNDRLTTLRKSFTALSCVTQATFAIGASYAGCDETLVATLSTIASVGQAFDAAGVDMVIFDLAPNYIASLTSLVYTITNIASAITPYVISFLAPHSYFSEWRLVFWLIFTTLICDTTIFTIWGSAEVQPWNSPKKQKDITCTKSEP